MASDCTLYSHWHSMHADNNLRYMALLSYISFEFYYYTVNKHWQVLNPTLHHVVVTFHGSTVPTYVEFESKKVVVPATYTLSIIS
jgi:hypothetical protein